MKYFWEYWTDLPRDIGVKTFGPVHIAWITVSFIIIASTISLYRRQNAAIKRRIQMTAAILMVMGYVIRWIWVAVIGHYSIITMLPLQLCIISVFVEFIAVISGNIICKEFSYCLGLPGAIVALINPGMGPYPLLSYFYLQFALAHTILILLPLIWIIVDGYRPSIHRFPQCFGIGMVFLVIAKCVNSMIGSNYMYINYAPEDSILKVFEIQFGNPGYLVPFAFLIIIAWLILYIPWVVMESKKNRIIDYRIAK